MKIENVLLPLGSFAMSAGAAIAENAINNPISLITAGAGVVHILAQANKIWHETKTIKLDNAIKKRFLDGQRPTSDEQKQ